MSSFLETKQQTQATTIENLRLETGWKFNALLIKETECTSNPSSIIFITDTRDANNNKIKISPFPPKIAIR